MKIAELIKDNKAIFQWYRDGNLWYKVLDFEFPVPISDTGTATFLKEDKAIFFMRWIRKHLEIIEDARNES